MSKSRPFSIYLLKEGYDSSNSLREEHHLKGNVQADSLPTGASLFVLDTMPTPPWWKAFFDVKAKLEQSAKGAIVFLPTKERWFALVFGHVSLNLRAESYEYDFGLRVTLNCIDPNESKSTDTIEPGAARRKRTQIPIGSDLTYFDFDRDSAILKSLAGKVAKEHKALFSNASGASNLSISSKATPVTLPNLCERLLALYESDNYKSAFSDIHNIAPVRDPIVLRRLEQRLLKALQEKDDSLYLAIPELIDYQSNVFYASFFGVGTSGQYEDVFLDRYYEYLISNNCDIENISYEDLSKHGLRLTNEEGDVRKRYWIIDCLIFDTTLDDGSEHTCQLSEGNWYKVENSYIARLKTLLDPLYVDLELPAYKHDNEGHYNRAVANGDMMICLDEENVTVSGQSPVEPCDIYRVDDATAIFLHIKRSTLSSKLSHLFNQGVNAIELLRSEEEAVIKLKALIESKATEAHKSLLIAPLEHGGFRVIFCMVTHKYAAAKSNNLPLFSRISLARAVRTLLRMSTKCNFGFIKDESVAKTVIAKKKAKSNKNVGHLDSPTTIPQPSTTTGKPINAG